MRCYKVVPLILAVFLIPQSSVRADWRTDIGHGRLQSEIGAGLETGTGINVAMSEAPAGVNYAPNLASSEFTGKAFTLASGGSGATNAHANNVAELFYGNTLSIAPGVTNVTLYDANNWINTTTGLASNGNPIASNYRIMNASWIGNTADPAVQTAYINVLQRIDFMVDRDELLVIGGVNNGAATAIPQLLASGYNSLAVGLTNGNGSAGLTTFNGAGRIRPHLVAPAGTTSSATPMVSSAATILLQKAGTTNAAKTETMRSILMAGATKDEFTNWDRTTTRPLDDRFGAGELNVFNSYKIIEGGEFNASLAQPSFSVGQNGWSYVSEITAADTMYYNFDVAAGFRMKELSIALNWNLDVTDIDNDPNIFSPFASLVNLDMRFFDASGMLIDQSISSVDNLEHLWLQNLSAGVYTLQITSDGTTDFGLAWRSSIVAVPEPSTWFLLGMIGMLVVWRGRMRSGRASEC